LTLKAVKRETTDSIYKLTTIMK